MPSFHAGWSMWSALALLPVVRSRWLRVLLVLYPVCTTFAIVVTANHWILDAVGGWAVLFVAWAVVTLWERWRHPAGSAGGLPAVTDAPVPTHA
jgi:membrane-associated phospholipid phosphatase